jgi:ABC-type transport system involved in Fe-S cluster assembly fused permease/ATPase subunit
MNRHLRALGKTFAIISIAAAIAQIAIWLLETFGAWFPLTVAITIIIYGVYKLCLDED